MRASDVSSRLIPICADAPSLVVAVYLYGSVARGTAHPSSDVDLAVLLRGDDCCDLPSGFLDALESTVGRPVDLVVLNSAPPDLVHRVLRDGMLLLDRDRAYRLRFEVQARNDYFDLEPVRRTYRSPRPAAPQA